MPKNPDLICDYKPGHEGACHVCNGSTWVVVDWWSERPLEERKCRRCDGGYEPSQAELDEKRKAESEA